MSEIKKQEILEKTENILYELNAIVLDDYDRKEHRENAQEIIYVIEGLLDLYNKEKEKNKWKPISEYNREKYDWVLVKYFDGEYECVPEVAEQRGDGKWYTTEREIPFEVKYFFDMQKLLEE